MLLSIVGGFWFLVDFDLRYFDLNLNDSSRHDMKTDLGVPDKNIKKKQTETSKLFKLYSSISLNI